MKGIDVTDRPLLLGRRDQSLTDVEVVLTDRINELIGTIADEQARPSPGTNIIAFSADRDRCYPSSRFLRKATAGPDGAFTMAGLASGAYQVAAVEQIPPDGEDAWQEPAFLESLLRRASTVTLIGGQKASLALRLSAR